jgi:hypothetical protein
LEFQKGILPSIRPFKFLRIMGGLLAKEEEK